MGIVANTAYTSAETGLVRGFEWYEDYPLTLRRALAMPGLTRQLMNEHGRGIHTPPLDDAGRVSAESVSRRFLTWLERHPRRPYFAFLNFYDAHALYSAPEPFWSHFLPDEKRRTIPIPFGPGDARAADPPRKAYDAAINHLDSALGALIGKLLQGGLLDNTLLIVTADHGEEFDEHGTFGHGQSLYTQAVRVPLLLFWPGHLPATRIANPVSLARLPATIMELVNLPGPFPGPSLVPLLRRGSGPDVAAVSMLSLVGRSSDVSSAERRSLSSVHVGRYHYIHHATGSVTELYDHATDPLEQRNLVGSQQVNQVVGLLRDSLAAATAGRRPRTRGRYDNSF